MENVMDIVRQQAEDAINKLGAQGVVTAEHVADSVLRQTAYWQMPMLDGEKLLFVRFFSPVVQREEVFLGNILFNAFLSKTFARSVAESEPDKVELVANDLESYYFLVCTRSDIAQLADAFRSEVEHSLPDLFFGEQDETRGIYGSLETMLDFVKANVEPFPVFIMPRSYEERLEATVRESLLRKVQKAALDRNPTPIMANLAFFYSHDGMEMQSPARFLGHLAFQHKLVMPKELEAALNIPKTEWQVLRKLIKNEKEFKYPQKKALINLVRYIVANISTPCCFGWLELFFSKTEKGTWELDAGKSQDQKPVRRLLRKITNMNNENIFDEIVKSVIAHRLSKIEACSKEKLRNVLKKVVVGLSENIKADSNTWRMPYTRAKFLSQSEETLTDNLLDGVSFGHVTISSLEKTFDIGCRVCGTRPVEAEDKSILMGQSTHKFNNQSSKQKNEKGPKVCLRCATCTYLMVKLIGSEAVGQPQIPKTYNLIFHYGRHDDEEIDHLTHTIDLVWSLVRQRREAERIRKEANKQIKALEDKLEREEDEQKKQELEAELAEKTAELEQTQAAIAESEDGIYTTCPWLKELGASPVPWENSSLDALVNIQLSESKVERHILGLGLGGYRMILFVLPQIRPPHDAKEHDFAQRRFSDSRVTVVALLSFLRELCGCDGPSYYQSLPTLTPDAFRRDTFYVRDEPISVQQAQNEYEVVTQLAWKLVPRSRRGGSYDFVRKVVLAEKLLEDPLGTFSAVMRDTAILGRDKGKYKQLPGEYRKDWGVHDLTEYAKFIRRLSEIGEVKRNGDQH